jgi:hypothetical protein
VQVFLGVKDKQVQRSNGETESLAKIAFWNHNGTETIPPRPFARGAMEEIVPKNKERIKAYIKNCIAMRGNAEAQQQLERVLLTSLGQQAARRAKEIIMNGETYPNAPSTVAQKGFDHPLFVNGEMARNVFYKVEET